MIKVVIFLAVSHLCLAVPIGKENLETHNVVPITSEDIDVKPDGSYHFSYEAGNGIKIHEEGVPKQIEKGQVVESVSGEYSYTSPDNQLISVKYHADETGFYPSSDSIPAIPTAIVRLLEYLETHPDTQVTAEKIN